METPWRNSESPYPGETDENWSRRDCEADEYMDAVRRGFLSEAYVKEPRRGGVDVEGP